ncbi:MAG TPA: PilZ domain-containing protein [Planctomycetota bacterium]|nr:PilZ domain-containing protein [Planctomycetota bacterium]
MDELTYVPCDFCKVQIHRKDFQEGRAVRVAGRHYCSQCMAKAIERGKNPDRPPDLRTPRPDSHLVLGERRRHERKDAAVAVEISIYLASGHLHHRGTALMRNVSLSGALLGGLMVPTKSIPGEPHKIGIRLLDGPLKDQEILGRVVRYIHRSEGSEVALEFERTETAKIEILRKII